MSVLAPKHRYARTRLQIVIIQLPKIGLCSTFEVFIRCAASVFPEDVSLEQGLPVAILALGNFMCLNWKNRRGTSRIWPSGDKNRAKLRHPSNMSSRFQSSFSFPATIRCDVTYYIIDNVGTVTPIAHIPMVLAPVHRETAFKMCTGTVFRHVWACAAHMYSVRFQPRAKKRKCQGTKEGRVFWLRYSFHCKFFSVIQINTSVFY